MRLGPSAFRAECRRAIAAKSRAANRMEASQVVSFQLAERIGVRALPTLAHAVDCHALIERAPRDGAYGRIHAGSVTTTGEDCDVLHGPGF